MPTKHPLGWPNLLLLALIGLVSAYDTALMVVYDIEAIQELNPIALWILNHGGVASFVAVKLVSTFLVLFLCTILLRTKHRFVVVVIAIFQLCLFYYLTFTDEKSFCILCDRSDTNPLADVFWFCMSYFSKS